MIERWFIGILNLSLTASYVVVVVLLARLLLARAPKRYSCLLWAVVLFRFLCPVSFDSVVSLLPTGAQPIPQGIIYQPAPAIYTGIVPLDNTVNQLLPAAAPQASANPLQLWSFVGGVIWLGGMALLVLYSLIALVRLQRQLRGAVCQGENVYRCDRLQTAFVTGTFRPRIYLPANLAGDQYDYILLHEQTHIRRSDHLTKLVGFVALCLHWFNPLAWVAFFLASKDIEMSCDEAVIKRLGGSVKQGYSASLLLLATGRRVVGGTPLAFGEGDTKSRVRHVLRYQKPALWVAAAAVVAVVALSVGLASNPQHPTTQWPQFVADMSVQGVTSDMLASIEATGLPREELMQLTAADIQNKLSDIREIRKANKELLAAEMLADPEAVRTDEQYVYSDWKGTVRFEKIQALVDGLDRGEWASVTGMVEGGQLPIAYELEQVPDGFLTLTVYSGQEEIEIAETAITAIYYSELFYQFTDNNGTYLSIPKAPRTQPDPVAYYQPGSTLTPSGITPGYAERRVTRVRELLYGYLTYARESGLGNPMSAFGGVVIPDDHAALAQLDATEQAVADGAATIGGQLYYRVSFYQNDEFAGDTYYIGADDPNLLYLLSMADGSLIPLNVSVE